MPFNPGAVVDKGTSIIAVAEVSDAWALKTLTAGTNALLVGHVANSDISQTTNKTEYKDESGKTVASDFEYSLVTTGTLMQTDKTTIDFMAESVKGKYFLEYKYQGLKDGKKQEMFKVGQVTPQFKMTTPGNTSSMPYEFTGIYPTATVTFNSTALAAIETALSITIYCTGVSITTSQGFVVKETV